MSDIAIKLIHAEIGYEYIASRNKSKDAIVLFNDLNLEFEKNKFYTILGVSGIGKTSILKTIVGLNKLLSGSIKVDGEAAILFQEPRLFPHMNVIDNVAYPLKLRGVEKNARYELAKELLSKLGVHDKVNSKISELSGGEAKRVSIARAIIKKPKILLLDEPLTNLDTGLKITIRNLIKEVHLENNLTTIMVTHDIFDSLLVSDELIVLDKNRVVASGDVKSIIDDENCEWYFKDFKTEIKEVIKKL